MVVLDSDLIIKYLRKKPKYAVEYLDDLFDSGEIMRTTIFNYAELIEGAYLAKNVLKNLRIVKDFLLKFDILHFRTQDAEKFSQVHAQLIKNGTLIGDMNVLIASIVLNHDETLITRNIKHFSMIPLLKIINWNPEAKIM